MAKLFLSLISLALILFASFAIQVANMVWGYGLEVKSWSVIISCFLASLVCTFLTVAITNLSKGE